MQSSQKTHINVGNDAAHTATHCHTVHLNIKTGFKNKIAAFKEEFNQTAEQVYTEKSAVIIPCEHGPRIGTESV